MSFRDFDPSTRMRQPKQKQEDGCYERQIKNLIENLQVENRAIKEELYGMKSNRRKRFLLGDFIVRSHEIAQNTESLFRDWQVFLAGEPHERHRKKFSVEKLRRAFDDEVRHLKDLASETLLLQEEQIKPLEPNEVEIPNLCDDKDEEAGLLSSQLEARVLDDRLIGIRRIQGQVSDVNQIFKDLQSIVHFQGNVLDSIENNASDTLDQTRKGNQELKITYDRQRQSRSRLCCLFVMALLFLATLILKQRWSHHEPPAPLFNSTDSSAKYLNMMSAKPPQHHQVQTKENTSGSGSGTIIANVVIKEAPASHGRRIEDVMSKDDVGPGT